LLRTVPVDVPTGTSTSATRACRRARSDPGLPGHPGRPAHPPAAAACARVGQFWDISDLESWAGCGSAGGSMSRRCSLARRCSARTAARFSSATRSSLVPATTAAAAGSSGSTVEGPDGRSAPPNPRGPRWAYRSAHLFINIPGDQRDVLVQRRQRVVDFTNRPNPPRSAATTLPTRSREQVVLLVQPVHLLQRHPRGFDVPRLGARSRPVPTGPGS
jgi:hypothetical protein